MGPHQLKRSTTQGSPLFEDIIKVSQNNEIIGKTFRCTKRAD